MIAGGDGILVLKEDTMRLIAASGEDATSGQPREPLALTALRDALDHWQRRAAPPISAHDCFRAVRLIDQGYELAGQPYG